MNSGRPLPFRALAAVLLLCSIACLPLSGCSGPAPAARASRQGKRGGVEPAGPRGRGARQPRRRDLGVRGIAQVNRSIEDFDGVAVALINLARVHRLKGELPPAKERIDDALRLVSPGSPLFPEAAFEKAKIDLAAGEPCRRREEWAGRPSGRIRGRSRGRMLNLLARVLFLEGRTDEARLARRNGPGGEPRVGARAARRRIPCGCSATSPRRAATGKAPRRATSRRWRSTRSIAESRKIAADLRALGAAAAARGETERAIVFYGRAAEVSRNGDDPKGAEAALLGIARLQGRPVRREGIDRQETSPSGGIAWDTQAGAIFSRSRDRPMSRSGC